MDYTEGDVAMKLVYAHSLNIVPVLFSVKWYHGIHKLLNDSAPHNPAIAKVLLLLLATAQSVQELDGKVY